MGRSMSKIAKKIREHAKGLEFTFHRAFDVTTTPLEDAVLDVALIGADRILTSGRAESAVQGVSTLLDIRNIIHKHKLEVGVVGAAGINADNVKTVVEEGGVEEVHLSGRVIAHSDATTSLPLFDTDYCHSSADKVRGVVEIVHSYA
mmetsp:Transcript_7019/g.17986  ORF Transcript_7019/g.17986 Transcript_7019/m.17986 type:complete len:147 (+) Transcript_7019:420-860(+)